MYVKQSKLSSTHLYLGLFLLSFDFTSIYSYLHVQSDLTWTHYHLTHSSR
jgi:hypothetical protein